MAFPLYSHLVYILPPFEYTENMVSDWPVFLKKVQFDTLIHGTEEQDEATVFLILLHLAHSIISHLLRSYYRSSTVLSYTKMEFELCIYLNLPMTPVTQCALFYMYCSFISLRRVLY